MVYYNLIVIASTFLTSYNYHGGTIVELDLFGPWKQKLLIGMSQAGVTAGIVLLVLFPKIFITTFVV